MRYEMVTQTTLQMALKCGLAGQGFDEQCGTEEIREGEKVNPWLRGSAFDRYDKNFRVCFFIAMDDSKPEPLIGYSRLALREYNDAFINLWMCNEVGVHAGYRKQGIGQKLFDMSVMKSIEMNERIIRNTLIAPELERLALVSGYKWAKDENQEHVWKMCQSFIRRHDIGIMPHDDSTRGRFYSVPHKGLVETVKMSAPLSPSSALGDLIERLNEVLKKEMQPTIPQYSENHHPVPLAFI